MGNERYISVLRRLFVWWWWWWSLHACTRTRSPHAHPHFPRISGGECGCLPSVALCRPSRLHCNEEAMFGAGVYPVPSITSRDYKTSVEDSEASDLSGKRCGCESLPATRMPPYHSVCNFAAAHGYVSPVTLQVVPKGLEPREGRRLLGGRNARHPRAD
ncbi:hypothetical protein B0H21DRAFT_885696 [Amylocystis lapponica]|nr:hypothetical protein B0H21DRAFT_885696 [Amylocystis lapponica]